MFTLTFVFAEALKQYFQLVLAGLAGSAHMISATELALTRILFEFKSESNEVLFSISRGIDRA